MRVLRFTPILLGLVLAAPAAWAGDELFYFYFDGVPLKLNLNMVPEVLEARRDRLFESCGLASDFDAAGTPRPAFALREEPFGPRQSAYAGLAQKHTASYNARRPAYLGAALEVSTPWSNWPPFQFPIKNEVVFEGLDLANRPTESRTAVEHPVHWIERFRHGFSEDRAEAWQNFKRDLARVSALAESKKYADPWANWLKAELQHLYFKNCRGNEPLCRNEAMRSRQQTHFATLAHEQETALLSALDTGMRPMICALKGAAYAHRPPRAPNPTAHVVTVETEQAGLVEAPL